MNKRYIIFGLIFFLNSSMAFGNSLLEISLFAKDICDSIRTEGSISRKEVTAKLEGELKGIAKLIGASVAADGEIKIDNTEYIGLPYDSLPAQMEDSRSCKKDIAKMLLEERSVATRNELSQQQKCNFMTHCDEKSMRIFKSCGDRVDRKFNNGEYSKKEAHYRVKDCFSEVENNVRTCWNSSNPSSVNKKRAECEVILSKQ